MYIVKCPLRLSLVGGSTDLQGFIDKFGKGCVISFPCSLYVYVSLHKNNRNMLILNYSESEEITDLSLIKNELAKEVITYFFKQPPSITLTFNSDIFSIGSGLAASTAYILSLIKVLSLYTNKHMSNFDICKLAIVLERKINPMTGYQDSYGCGIANFKKIEFVKDSMMPNFTYYSSNFMDNFNINLIYTNENRNSTDILSTINFDKALPLLQSVNKMHESIDTENISNFLDIINDSWAVKKDTSKNIMTKNLEFIEQDIQSIMDFEKSALKLCGAGAGGYFLLLSVKTETKLIDYVKMKYKAISVHVDEEGIKGIKL